MIHRERQIESDDLSPLLKPIVYGLAAIIVAVVVVGFAF